MAEVLCMKVEVEEYNPKRKQLTDVNAECQKFQKYGAELVVFLVAKGHFYSSTILWK